MGKKCTNGKISSRSCLLTYPQSKVLSIRATLEFLKTKYPDLIYLIVEENHKSGEPHIHARIERGTDRQFPGKITLLFDITLTKLIGQGKYKFHPNVTKTSKKTINNQIIYLLKQQNIDSYNTPEQMFLCNFPEPIISTCITMIKEKLLICKPKDVAWLSAINLAEADNFNDAVQMVRLYNPKEFVINYNEIVKTLRNLYKLKASL